MEMNNEGYPDVSAEQRTSSELAKLIRKLRWIGMEKEAENVQVLLRHTESSTTLSARYELDRHECHPTKRGADSGKW